MYGTRDFFVQRFRLEMTQILKDIRCGVRATGCLDNMTAKAQHRQLNKQNLTCLLPDALNGKSPQFGLEKVVFRIAGVIIAEGETRCGVKFKLDIRAGVAAKVK